MNDPQQKGGGAVVGRVYLIHRAGRPVAGADITHAFPEKESMQSPLTQKTECREKSRKKMYVCVCVSVLGGVLEGGWSIPKNGNIIGKQPRSCFLSVFS